MKQLNPLLVMKFLLLYFSQVALNKPKIVWEIFSPKFVIHGLMFGSKFRNLYADKNLLLK